MKWFSHLAFAIAPTALISPQLMAPAALGAIAPDLLERVINVKHRQETHIFIYWLGASVLGLVLAFTGGGYFWHLAALMLGGLSHIILDSLTPAGVPLAPNSMARVHFFGGRVVTGSVTEYALIGAFVAVCVALYNSTGGGLGFVPFGWDWASYYSRGLVDGHEWRINRFRFF